MKERIVECFKCLGYILATFVSILLIGLIGCTIFEIIESLFGFWGVPMAGLICFSILTGTTTYKYKKEVKQNE